MTHLKKRPFITYSILWLLGFALLMVSCILIVLTLPMPSTQASGVLLWAKQHQLTLQFADELLVFSAPTLLAAVLFFYEKIKKCKPVLSSLMLALFLVLTIGILYTVFSLGRLVYPVNGLSLTPELALMAASQVFAGLHLMALALVPCVIIVAIINNSRIVMFLSVLTSLAQIVGTYYAAEVSVPLVIIAMFVLSIWAVVVLTRLKPYFD
ncbi:hypothetical protein [Streptococcus pacificus]|uniref:DUF4386 domain-containing protein n=1 Tax=Streptococcus pacificus TaxID=2740577 RepID=A0ABS0ZHZ5_9STRE|nr:hypothetical protein [Streptococcus pacificus]MBJ8325628.1 hypothetical protein [Streptococcus pacificus]